MSVQTWQIGWLGGVRVADVAGGLPQERDRVPPLLPDRGAWQAELSGFEEVPPRLTPATGTFVLHETADGMALEYELSYAGLSSPTTAAHIHFGQPGVNGEIIAFLCGGNGKPSCPALAGTITGTITADDIRAVPEQGLAAGDFAGALRIIRAGLAYVNVHTENFPAGEIRGQILP